MTRTGWLAAMAAVAAMACGRGSGLSKGNAKGEGGAHDPGPTPTPPKPEDGGCHGKVSVVLRGIDGDAVGTFDLDLAGIDVAHAGAAHATEWLASGTVSALGDARLVTVADDGCGALDVTVRLGRVHVCGASDRCGDVDGCSAPITFRFDPARVNPATCELVVRLDLARSLQGLAGGGLAFLPNFSIRY